MRASRIASSLCRRLLTALHISPTLLEQVISSPERFWRTRDLVREKKTRELAIPDPCLARMQVRAAQFLRNRAAGGALMRGTSATAFERGCSVVRNAEAHRFHRSGLRIDLKDAFDGIRMKHVAAFIERQGEWVACIDFDSRHGLPSDRIVRAVHIAWLFSRLLTFRSRLRQGAPCSPTVFNLLMERFDSDIRKELGAVSFCADRRHGELVYTRYGDDLCFSSPEETFPETTAAAIFAIIGRHHLVPNGKKTRAFSNGVIELTGTVIVRGRIRPTAAYVRRLLETAPSLTEKQRNGHSGFLAQFGKEGRLAALKHVVS